MSRLALAQQRVKVARLAARLETEGVEPADAEELHRIYGREAARLADMEAHSLVREVAALKRPRDNAPVDDLILRARDLARRSTL
jgi:hypothetical protein